MLTRILCLAVFALPATAVAAEPAPTRTEFPAMPKAVASFGAVVCNGYLYVYGGHAGKTHSYDTESVLGTFHRFKLDGGTKWEELPGGPRAQGMNLVAHGGKVYRVGGMQPRNKPGDPADNHSLAECARFDPKVGKWEELPALPAGRSSHDVVVVGDKLVVVGGWQMRGKGEKSVWHETVAILDLAAKELQWESVRQPFQRRALTATAVGSKVYVLGGLGADGKPTDVFDVETKKWSTAPALPGEGKKAMAFSPSAATVGGRVVVNMASGTTYRLNEKGDGWEKVGAVATPRIVARMVPLGPTSVALVGGAAPGEGNVATVEVMKLADKGEPIAPAKQP
jgi:N-acetylneuraminic acid mutarotase